MKKSEIFFDILHKVVEVCEVREIDVMNAMKAQAVVDSRCMVVRFCRRLGLANEDISYYVLKHNGVKGITYEMVKKKSKMVDNLNRSFDVRHSQSHAFRMMCHDIDMWCIKHFGMDDPSITAKRP